MATFAHCLYCFEVLSSSLERRSAFSLREIDHRLGLYVKAHAQGVNEDQEGDNNYSHPSDGSQKFQRRDHRPGDVQHQHKPNVDEYLLALPIHSTQLALAGSTSMSAKSSPSNVSTVSPSPSTDLLSAIPSSTSSLSSTLCISKPHPASSNELRQYPMFVTWNILTRSGQKRLRGCIGTFEALELENGLRTYALTAAFEDTRFPRIEAQELPNLECVVTLLTDFETVSNPLAWDIGVHGLRISFSYCSRRCNATYLPDVALDQGWTKVVTMVSLMRKAGWRGRDDEWHKVVDLRVVRYQGHRVTAKYNEWKSLMDWMSQLPQTEEHCSKDVGKQK